VISVTICLEFDAVLASQFCPAVVAISSAELAPSTRSMSSRMTSFSPAWARPVRSGVPLDLLDLQDLHPVLFRPQSEREELAGGLAGGQMLLHDGCPS
jgi:hypothetical protein